MDTNEENIKSNAENSKESSKAKKSILREIVEWVLCIVVAFSLALFIKFFIFTPTLVMQSSMTPTILDGERVFINRLVRTFDLSLNRGDIITFEAPTRLDAEYTQALLSGDVVAKYKQIEGPINKLVYYVMEIGKTSYIKRVIGIAGDHIKIENGNLYINDELQDEEYIPEGVETLMSSSSSMPNDFIVPEGTVFCLGDNRMGSSDCRIFGCVPLEKVEGRVVIRIWPLTKFGSIGPAKDIENYAVKSK